MTGETAAALAELSELLGVEVLRVEHDRPAHERTRRVFAGDEPSLPREPDGGVAREWWHLRVALPEHVARELPRGVRGPRELRLLTDDVRDPRRLAAVLARVAGVPPRVRDRRSARGVLRLMHEATRVSDESVGEVA